MGNTKISWIIHPSTAGPFRFAKDYGKPGVSSDIRKHDVTVCSFVFHQIITCESKQHFFCKCCVTTCLESYTTAKNAEGELVKGLTCPSEKCGSQLESFLLQDIASQLPRTRQGGVVVKKLRGRRKSAIACQNHHCSFFFYHQPDPDFDPDFDVLFATCPGCHEAYCLTCKSRLSSQGFRDHICPVDEDDDITDKDISQRLLEVLMETLSIRCTSNQCKSSDRDGHLAAKEPQDCNAVKCDRCRRFFCYICSKDLGTKRQEAHNGFPHR